MLDGSPPRRRPGRGGSRLVREAPRLPARPVEGAAFLSLSAHRRRGVEVVAEAAGLADVEGADLVLTGEGSIDSQTLAGKTPAGVANRTLRRAREQ